MKNEVKSYSAGSKWIHWLIAVAMILMLSLSFFMDDLAKPDQPMAYMIHKSTGLTILALMVIRLLWIQIHGKPILPLSVPHWQRVLARAVQYSLYLFVILMPISGWIMSVAANHTPTFFNLFSLPLPITPNHELAELMEDIHKTIAWILIGLVVLHVVGALKHYFIDRDKVLQTMLPGKHV